MPHIGVGLFLISWRMPISTLMSRSQIALGSQNKMAERTSNRRTEKCNRFKAAIPHIEVRYAVELARGASVIASTLSEASLMQAVGDTLSGFVVAHGMADLDAFIHVLGERVMQRDRPDALKIIASWQPFPSKQ
ncbi:hypothetical protein ACFQ3P_42555 [Paraburkholderia sabiae]|uniref:Uncharacterized protein n=1 Tax=Paraburkholderia sabiae TaxID=273251 RepID=A0ABU9QSD1_9BURK|nr:hypothetical protein [Paraburkholderia sabiae]WJZ72214.1 hypothetical protein QEN71_18740 [Paraburkholderia sabiae]